MTQYCFDRWRLSSVVCRRLSASSRVQFVSTLSKVRYFTTNSFHIVVVCSNKVERCFDIVACLDGALCSQRTGWPAARRVGGLAADTPRRHLVLKVWFRVNFVTCNDFARNVIASRLTRVTIKCTPFKHFGAQQIYHRNHHRPVLLIKECSKICRPTQNGDNCPE